MKKLNYIMMIIILSCNNKNDFIQEVYVNETIDLNLPMYSDISTPGNSIFVEGGVRGIIIYHGVGNDYHIYDRNCSYEPSLSCSQIDSINAGIAYCECCPSVFSLYNAGEPINSPALLPLKSYNWTLENNILRIFN